MQDSYLLSIYFAWLINPVISTVLFIPAFILTFRYNFHMFQLNGYKNNEQRTWIKKNASKQWVLYAAAIMAAVRIIVFFIPGWYPVVVPGIVFDLWMIVLIIIYGLYKKRPAKKKFVYTPRVKRLIITDTVIVILLLVLEYFVILTGTLFWTETLLLYLGLQFVMPMVCNTINKPVEKHINNGFINEAKSMLESVDGIKVIGITGSYGKTSVKFYLNTLLREKYNVLMTPESFNTPMGVVRTIREHLKPTHEIFLCEMGARYVGDIKEICDIAHPEMGIITSIGPQHLETFGDIEHIKSTKFELADAVANKGHLYLNGDNEYIRDKAAGYSDIIYYHAGESDASGFGAEEASQGKDASYGYYARDISVSRLGTEFTVVEPNGSSERFNMRLVGEHNIINVVGAIAVAHSLGIELRDLKIPVRRIEPVPHRLQLIERGPVTIIDDAYNSNPVGSKAAVETLAMFEGQRILVTPGMVELGEAEDEYNYKFGTYAAACCDHIILVGESHTKPIYKGALDSGFAEDRIRVFERLEDAVSYAYTINGEGHKYILLENDLPDNY